MIFIYSLFQKKKTRVSLSNLLHTGIIEGSLKYVFILVEATINAGYQELRDYKTSSLNLPFFLPTCLATVQKIFVLSNFAEKFTKHFF